MTDPAVKPPALTKRQLQYFTDATPRIGKLVGSLARQYRVSKAVEEEMFQEACAGAASMAPEYDPSKAEFITYVWPRCLREATRAAIKEQSERRGRAMLALAHSLALVAEGFRETRDPMTATEADLRADFEVVKNATTAALFLSFLARPTPEGDLVAAEDRRRAEVAARDILASFDPLDAEMIRRTFVGGEHVTEICRERGADYKATWRHFHKLVASFGAELAVRGVGPDTARSLAFGADFFE